MSRTLEEKRLEMRRRWWLVAGGPACYLPGYAVGWYVVQCVKLRLWPWQGLS